ncbi:MAG TPA: hypothetical protein VGP45_00190 [Marinobacter sp.]|nr:hypothetical protein [Marinobacter sp.]
MKKLITLVFAVFASGCSTQQEAITQDDLDAAVVGEMPAGYPKVTIKRLPDRPGFCVKVTESWKAYDYEGQTVWIREKNIESLNCPWSEMPWPDRSAIRRIP